MSISHILKNYFSISEFSSGSVDSEGSIGDGSGSGSGWNGATIACGGVVTSTTGLAGVSGGEGLSRVIIDELLSRLLNTPVTKTLSPYSKTDQ